MIVGLGNELRGDDGAGLLAARRLRERLPASRRPCEVHEHTGEGDGLLELWQGAGATLVLDAARTGAPPGTVLRFDAASGPLAGGARGAGTGHAIALAAAIELARVLALLPPRTIVLAIEGERFALGDALSPAVAGGLDRFVDAAERELAALCSRH